MSPPKPQIQMVPDPCSQSNFLQVSSTHVAFDWLIDFEARNLSGSVTHTVVAKVDGVEELILDTSALSIHSVEIDGKPINYKLDPKHEVMGSALHIPFFSPLKKDDVKKVTVKYKTTEACTALGWLEKEQTQGKKFPYLFSQCQPIYARSLVPVQDSSSVKITYEAKVTSVLPALMSAIRVSPPSDGPPHDGKVVGQDLVTYTYDQPIPIPTYLIAIAAGDVVYKPFPQVDGKTWKSGVWAEPELIDAAYWEFYEHTDKFLKIEETIVPPYRFGVYDLLVLPPAFPYGGMENACLTFLTPTLLTGDRTLVDVIAHELTHSWFGNGVTQANSSHFWLNEGFTTYIERVLLEKLHTPADRGFSYLIGYKGLQDDLKLFQEQKRYKYQRLVIEYELGEDPDDAYCRVPYDKGANFLLYLERQLGGLDVFLKYINDYVSTFMGTSITTTIWKDHLYEHFRKNYGEEKIKALDGIDWNAWLFGEGVELPVKMEYDLSLAEQAYKLAERWDASRATPVTQLDFAPSDVEGFNSNQKIVFLERLQSYPPLPPSHTILLGKLYEASTTFNAEIRQRFYEVALRLPSDVNAGDSDSIPSEIKTFASEAAKWVVGKDKTGVIKGRMKFCRPVFRDVAKVDRELAVKTFEGSKKEFHPIAQRLIEKDLGLA